MLRTGARPNWHPLGVMIVTTIPPAMHVEHPPAIGGVLCPCLFAVIKDVWTCLQTFLWPIRCPQALASTQYGPC